ncbi:hypothetical protein V5799_026292 [Amblyomma americanum]|uniref:Uncharacterized protein n=1 Tax=Amblyomma americanum TaxID=6943 RepID=A0AAQ4DJ03_AMBAM
METINLIRCPSAVRETDSIIVSPDAVDGGASLLRKSTKPFIETPPRMSRDNVCRETPSTPFVTMKATGSWASSFPTKVSDLNKKSHLEFPIHCDKPGVQLCHLDGGSGPGPSSRQHSTAVAAEPNDMLAYSHDLVKLASGGVRLSRFQTPVKFEVPSTTGADDVTTTIAFLEYKHQEMSSQSFGLSTAPTPKRVPIFQGHGQPLAVEKAADCGVFEVTVTAGNHVRKPEKRPGSNNTPLETRHPDFDNDDNDPTPAIAPLTLCPEAMVSVRST